MLSQVALIALATSALALQITSPGRNELWDLSTPQTIEWNSVNTDVATFDIYLAHMASHPPSYTLLAPNINKDVGSFVVTGLQLPLGDTYQINFVAHDRPEQIYAQSQQFNLTGEAVAATSTLDGYTGPTFTPSASAESSNTGSVTRTTLRTLTTTSGSATITETSTGTTTEAASATESDASESAAAESGSRTVSGAGSATNAAVTASRTPNAAVGNGASAPLAALVFGVAAFFL